MEVSYGNFRIDIDRLPMSTLGYNVGASIRRAFMSASPNAPSDSSVGKYPTSVDVVWQLERILAHPLFKRSLRLSAILRFTVESVLAGRGEEQLKERTIGVEALHLGPS